MAARFNHTIVHARDALASATFLSEMLDLPPPSPFGVFLCVETANGVSLDFIDAGDYEFATHPTPSVDGHDRHADVSVHRRRCC